MFFHAFLRLQRRGGKNPLSPRKIRKPGRETSENTGKTQDRPNSPVFTKKGVQSRTVVERGKKKKARRPWGRTPWGTKMGAKRPGRHAAAERNLRFSRPRRLGAQFCMVLKFNTGRIPTIRHSKILSDREIFLTQAKLSKVLRERHTTGKKWYREGVQGEKRSGAAPVLRDKGGARSAPPSLLAGTKNNSLKNEIPGPRKYFDDFARIPPAPLSLL